MTIQISIPCDKMAVRHHSRGVMVTDRLPATATITLEDGSKLETPITFPETFVREDSLTIWIVSECVTVDGAILYLYLPPEKCVLQLTPFPPHMVAKEITAKGKVFLPDGSKWNAKVVFPDARSDWKGPGHWEVSPVVATGTAERI